MTLSSLTATASNPIYTMSTPHGQSLEDTRKMLSTLLVLPHNHYEKYRNALPRDDLLTLILNTARDANYRLIQTREALHTTRLAKENLNITESRLWATDRQSSLWLPQGDFRLPPDPSQPSTSPDLPHACQHRSRRHTHYCKFLCPCSTSSNTLPSRGAALPSHGSAYPKSYQIP